jgi:hypothetical protein
LGEIIGPVIVDQPETAPLTTTSISGTDEFPSHLLEKGSTSYGDAGIDGATTDIERAIHSFSGSDSEDAMQEAISRLDLAMRLHGQVSIDALHLLLMSGKVNEDAAFDVLWSLGQIDDHRTRPARSWLLTRALRYPSAKIREGALLGIASIDNPSAIAVLTRAIEVERHARLRRHMEKVLVQLEETVRNGPTPQKSSRC